MRARVAVMGLGPMGAPIARNLAAAGVRPEVWNRSAVPVDRVRGLDVVIVDSPAAIGAATILSVLPDVDQLREASGPEVWRAWRGAGVERVVVMSTTSPGKVRALAADLGEYGISVADAPMSGGERGAIAGTMSVMVGAEAADWAELEPLFGLVAGTVLHFGGPGAGSVAKLCNQVVVAGTLTSIAESLALAERAGIDRAALLEIFAGGLASSAVLSAKRERLLERDYAPSGSAVNQLKDLRYVHELADELAAVTPVSDALRELFTRVVDDGRGAEDHSVVLEQFRAGLPS